MAIDWPADLRPTGMTWGMDYNNRSFTSTLSNAQQVVSYPGAYWQCQLTFGVLTRPQERILTSLLGALQGMAGTVKMPAFTRRKGNDIGNPLVVTAGAQASTMQLKGVTPSAKVFSLGDYITAGDQLFEVIQDAMSDSGGNVSVRLNKRIRTTIPANSPVEYRNPYAIMRRADGNNQITSQPVISNASMSFREAF